MAPKRRPARSSRTLIVANRLPVRVSLAKGVPHLVPSPGGVASGLLASRQDLAPMRWIGWLGPEAGGSAESLGLGRELRRDGLVPVPLSKEIATRFYEGYSNGVLWPLFHYTPSSLPLEIDTFESYRTANRRFADSVASAWRRGDRIWAHDYQLLLLPAMLRARIPQAPIGFFLHIPFPTVDLFRILPQRMELLEGMLGADLLGFHTASYQQHFLEAVRVLLPQALVEGDVVRLDGREIRTGAFPMGIDVAAFERRGRHAVATGAVARLRRPQRTKLIVGIDRLDYTKGIPRRLLAFERLLRTHPEWRGKVRFIQVTVPSRSEVDSYQEFRGDLDQLIGRIHGAFATPDWSPVHYLKRGFSQTEVAALYRAADVMLVTPIRDGMNLVAKEFVAVRTDLNGVLVLSEFAGAAAELAEAEIVNPFDIQGLAQVYHRALTMPRLERRARMRELRQRVVRQDVREWARGFRDALDAVPRPAHARPGLTSILARARRAERLLLLLDYDGTLVPFQTIPEAAAPDAELLELLDTIRKQKGRTVWVVSGRARTTLQGWLGHLRIGLVAEHGLWYREPAGKVWHRRPVGSLRWLATARQLVDRAVRETPGSRREDKSAGVVFHWRGADHQRGRARAAQLTKELAEALEGTPGEILSGHCVVEVRPAGTTKGWIGTHLAPRFEGTRVIAIGDDGTDEDLFASLPSGAVTVRVGAGESSASHRLRGVPEVRQLLRALLDR
jgi:trehalose 6-phosphate synthase/phosphatase